MVKKFSILLLLFTGCSQSWTFKGLGQEISFEGQIAPAEDETSTGWWKSVREHYFPAKENNNDPVPD